MNTKNYLTTLVIVLILPLLALADWATDMFKDTSHDFGMVARGADTRFSFVFTNKYKEDVVIESVRSTCRCTQPSYHKQVIKTWETSQIDIQLDTRNFTGRKDATITVRFSKPFPTEIQLHSFCLIRTDVYVEPGVVAFGTVQQGQPRTQTFRVNYAGQAYWQTWAIRDIQSESTFYKASIALIQRDYTNVSYNVTLTLKENAPEGYLHDFIDIISNDPNPGNQHCPVPVSGYIIPSVTVKPSPLAFGTVNNNQSVTKTVVLSGPQPFSVTGFVADKNSVTARISNEVKTVHIIPVTITHDGKGGNVTGEIVFKVSSQEKPVRLMYSADLHIAAKITQLPRKITPVDNYVNGNPVNQSANPFLEQIPVQTADDIPESTAVQSQNKQSNTQSPVVIAPAVEENKKPLTPAQQYFPPRKEENVDTPADATPVAEEKEVAPVPVEEKEVAPAPVEEMEVAPVPVEEKEIAPAPVEEKEVAPAPVEEKEAAPAPVEEKEVAPAPIADDDLPPPPVDETSEKTPPKENKNNNNVKEEVPLPLDDIELPPAPPME